MLYCSVFLNLYIKYQIYISVPHNFPTKKKKKKRSLKIRSKIHISW